jgi:hypothetical protein
MKVVQKTLVEKHISTREAIKNKFARSIGFGKMKFIIFNFQPKFPQGCVLKLKVVVYC